MKVISEFKMYQNLILWLQYFSLTRLYEELGKRYIHITSWIFHINWKNRRSKKHHFSICIMPSTWIDPKPSGWWVQSQVRYDFFDAFSQEVQGLQFESRLKWIQCLWGKYGQCVIFPHKRIIFQWAWSKLKSLPRTSSLK